jgi:thiamine pyrophosphokinase
MDSLPDTGILAEYDAARVIRFPREKDYTDTELALNLLREKGCARSILVGGGGGRLDHLLAVYSLFHRSSPPSVWVTDKYEVVYIKEKYRLTARPGEEVSFFPVGEGSVRMKSRGLKWPLDSLEWRTGDAGVSNIVTEAPAEIEVLSGAVILLSALSALPQGGLLS